MDSFILDEHPLVYVGFYHVPEEPEHQQKLCKLYRGIDCSWNIARRNYSENCPDIESDVSNVYNRGQGQMLSASPAYMLM